MSTPELDNHGEDRGAEVLPFPDRSDGEPAVLDAEIVRDDDPGRDPGQVVNVPDSAAPSIPAWQTEPTRHPIIAPWLADRAQRGQATRWALGNVRHSVLLHLTYSPFYLAKLAWYSPAGAWRVVRGVAGWVGDAQAAPLRAAAIRGELFSEYDKLQSRRDLRVKLRGGALALAVAAVWIVSKVVLPGVLPEWAWAPTWLPTWVPGLALALLLVTVLGRYGRPADKPIAMTAVVIPRVQRLTSEIVTRALGSLGIAELGKAAAKGTGITFPAPITRDGPGWRADVDLPLGVTARDVISRREKLASGLRRPLGCVWPDGNSEVHEGRLVLWVGDKDLSKTGLVRWAYATTGRHDYFAPVPFGVDPRGRPITVPLFQHNVLIGSLPGQGKTGAVRVLACGVALDPTAELWLHELKGSGDLDPLECVSHRFVSGIDDDSIGYAAESMGLLRAEVMRRAAAMKLLPRDLCPDKRVTRQIADRRTLRLHPLVCVVDECQNLYAHPDHGKQAGADAEFVIKVGRAFGVTLIQATQRPDKDSLPTGISANVSIRFCLMVAGQVENDMVLGTSAYSNGLRATTFRPEIDAGIGHLVGAAPAPLVARVAYLDQLATDRVAKRARALREAAGTLTGHAVGEAPGERTPAADLLEDLTVVFASSERLWNEDVVTGLAQLRPDVYGGWTAAALSSALRQRYGIETRQVWIDGKNRQGLHREQVHAALAGREAAAIEPGEPLGDA